MRYTFLPVVIVLVLFASCTKNDPVINIPPGLYKGTFKRSYVQAAAQVSLTFATGTFVGQSDTLHYPDICSGSFSINRDTIAFTNGCFYTAEFDWSYILSGKFTFSLKGDSLTIARSSNGIFYYEDIYSLKKQ